jgi:two-component system sensor histidine kinase UhpB
MSLKIRIVLLFALLLFLGLAADIGRMAINARTRIQAESAATTRVTRDFVEAALANFQGSRDPEGDLRQLAHSLDSLRHVRVAFVRDPAGAAMAALTPDNTRLTAPDWFEALVKAKPSVTVLPAIVDGRPLGDVVIARDPADEVNEIWLDVRNLALTGGGIALAALMGAGFLLALDAAIIADAARREAVFDTGLGRGGGDIDRSGA